MWVGCKFCWENAQVSTLKKSREKKAQLSREIWLIVFLNHCICAGWISDLKTHFIHKSLELKKY